MQSDRNKMEIYNEMRSLQPIRHKTEIYKEIDNVYLNISFQPDYLSNQPYPLEYNVTKDTPILDKMSDYFLSVIRFDIPLSEIPVTIAPPLPNQNPSDSTYPNLLALIIGINYNSISTGQRVLMVQETNDPVPAQNFPYQNITPYYWIYSYDWFVQMINTALLTAYNVSVLPGLFPAALPPYFTYNSTTQLLSLIVPSFFVNLTAPAIAIPTINFNFNFLQYLDAFPIKLLGLNNINGFDIMLDLKNGNVRDINAYGLNGQLPANPPIYYKIDQSQIIIQYWNPIKKLLLTSESIPVAKEYIQSGSTSSLNPSLPIVTDFTPVVEQAGQQRTIAYYLPTAEYRKVNMLSELPLQKVSLKVFWEDLYGKIYLLNIGSYQSASVKIVFLHKSMYKKN